MTFEKVEFNYNGKIYLAVEVTIEENDPTPDLLPGESVIFAGDDLERVLIAPNTFLPIDSKAEWIDDQIFFYFGATTSFLNGEITAEEFEKRILEEEIV